MSDDGIRRASDLEIAKLFRAALETAVRTGDHEALLDLVAPDVEWVTPQRTLRGIEELETWRIWGSSPQGFDFEFSEGEWLNLGDGRVVCDMRQVYRVKESGDLAYERVRQIELTIREGKISRYELRFQG
jgi:ketosteroid isomerase-like protein